MTPQRCALLFATLTLAVGARTVAADELSGVYVGGNFGRARSGYDTNAIDSQLAGEAADDGDTLNPSRRSTSRLSYAWSADAGYFFTPYLGLEAAFLHVGEIRHIAVGTVTGSVKTDDFVSTTEITSHGPALSLVLRLPLTEAFEADLRLGDYFGKTTYDNYLSVGPNADFVGPSNSGSSLLAGVGAAYNMAGHYSIRLDYLRIEHTGGGDAGAKFDVNLVTAGLSYSF